MSRPRSLKSFQIYVWKVDRNTKFKKPISILLLLAVYFCDNNSKFRFVKFRHMRVSYGKV